MAAYTTREDAEKYPFEPRVSFAAPVIDLPYGVDLDAAVVGAPGAFVSLGPANTYEPRPVLCLRPMTAGDARYDAGRRAGLLEAAGLLREGASLLRGGGLLSRAVSDGLRQVAERIEAKAGAP